MWKDSLKFKISVAQLREGGATMREQSYSNMLDKTQKREFRGGEQRL
jgi:hypothetical protein